MIIRLILAAAVLFLIFWFSQKLKSMPLKKRRATVIQIVFWSVIIFTLVAAFTGRIHWLGALAAGIFGIAKFSLTYLTRFLPFLNLVGRHGNFSNPVFKTQYLELSIDLQNGQISGSVISGPCAGKNITQLSHADLAELESYYKEKETRSYYLIRVIKQRVGAQKQQDKQDKQANYSQVGDPSPQEAQQILGLGDKPSKEEIIKAHKQLIQKLHPDRGGNDYLASRVNQAKDVLLKHLDNS